MYSSSSHQKRKPEDSTIYLALTLFFLPNPIPIPTLKLKVLFLMSLEVGESVGIGGGIRGLVFEMAG